MKVFLTALLLASTAAPAFARDTSGATVCALHGFSTDTDPKGTNVRNGPDAKAPIIGHIPPQHALGGGADETVGATFAIIGSKNGWLLVRNAGFGALDDDSTNTAYIGPGWISGELAGFVIGSPVLLRAPSNTAPIVAKLDAPDKGWGADSYGVKRVNGCSGHFADVTVQSPDANSKPIRGWARKVCADQLTTCDPN